MLDFLFGEKHLRWRLDVATVSRTGLVRKDNQDHFVADSVRAFFAVADGMGGGQGGAEASEIVCANLARAASEKGTFPDRLKEVAAALENSNAEIREFARKAGYEQMATTATLLMLDAPATRSAVVANVGDSRVYRLRDGFVSRLSRDHTVLAELGIRPPAAAKDGASGENAAILSLSHVLTRAVGSEREVRPDWKKLEVRPGDAFLLCSDGVYGMVSDDEIAKSFAAGTAEEIVADIEKKILASGAEDNYTAVVARIGGGE